ncbi:hypothetical protein Noda2021_06500 [Candidatus Dependentiae bacterium Noda2021]|nr:hypothetical protein Noda2021_06500 [Candidatus Dependentiae bacterium Noda2021]
MMLKKYFLLNLLVVPTLFAMELSKKPALEQLHGQDHYRQTILQETLAEVIKLASSANNAITVFGFDPNATDIDNKINNIIHNRHYFSQEIFDTLNAYYLIDHMPKSAKTLNRHMVVTALTQPKNNPTSQKNANHSMKSLYKLSSTI